MVISNKKCGEQDWINDEKSTAMIIIIAFVYFNKSIIGKIKIYVF